MDGEGNPIIESSQDVNFCAAIFVDTNGVKGPNQFGRDTFYLLFFPDRFSPHSDTSKYGDLNKILKTGTID